MPVDAQPYPCKTLTADGADALQIRVRENAPLTLAFQLQRGISREERLGHITITRLTKQRVRFQSAEFRFPPLIICENLRNLRLVMNRYGLDIKLTGRLRHLLGEQS